MMNKHTLAAMAVGSLFTSYLQAQDAPKTLPEEPNAKPETTQMKTLFSGIKNPAKKINYLGLSVGSVFQYGTLAGQFTPMAGVSGMLHINKKWGLGLEGVNTLNHDFGPTALSSTKTFNLNSAYGGLKLEYTPKPNAAVHVSFPFLIGAGMARVDSVGDGERNDRRGFDNQHGRDHGRKGFGRDGTGFMVVQPGVNIEANIFRYAKIYAGVSYRIVPFATNETTTTTTTYPIPTAGQLGGLNLSIGAKVGLFDYKLHRQRRQKRNKTRVVPQ